MNQDGMYYRLTQGYHILNKEKRELMSKRDSMNTRIEMINTILDELNDILCTYGKHIYEHFEENEPQESEK